MGTELMKNLLNDVQGEEDNMDTKTAKKLLKRLFIELKIPISNKELNEFIKTVSKVNKISKEQLKSLITRSIPSGKKI